MVWPWYLQGFVILNIDAGLGGTGVNILVVGKGGREHALVWKISQSSKVKRIYCAPGNSGIGRMATCVPIPEDDPMGLVNYAMNHQIDLTLVGPEAPLLQGIVDMFEARGQRIFGPSREAAMIEGSKEFAKRLMVEAGVPTARFASFDQAAEAIAYIREQGAPIVVKADGLAAGKGVVVARTVEEAERAVHAMMNERVFGTAGSKVVIEEYMEGEEVSMMAFVDGKTVSLMVEAQDHKPVGEGDTGPNTGGMGAYSPVPRITPFTREIVDRRIMRPMLHALAKRGIEYKGVLYAGLMLTRDGPKVVEFNARFGDPETQVVLPRLETDLVDIALAVCEGKLKNTEIVWNRKAAVCVVAASEGYPGQYAKGDGIEGLDAAEAEGVLVFHAGTAKDGERIVTAGGRVLGVTGLGADLSEARASAYRGLQCIRFRGMHYRRDIGLRGMQSSE
jgi:phosphoribosylamine--glycine ligase